MNITEGEHPQFPKNPGRRRALKFLAGGGLALAAGSSITQEAQATQEPVKISANQFVPLLEIHSTGISKEIIPNKLTTILREGAMNNEAFGYTPQGLLSAGFEYITPKADMPNPNNFPNLLKEKALDAKEDLGRTSQELLNNKFEFPAVKRPSPTDLLQPVTTNLFQEGVLEKLARNGTRIMFGDVDLGIDDMTIQWILIPGMVAGLSAGIAAFIDLQKKEDKTPEEQNNKTSRRTFLKKSLLAGAAVWGLSPLVRRIHSSTSGFLEQSNAIQRVLTTLNRMQSNFHPEDLNTYFRSIVMANKMLTVAEKSNHEGQKEIMGFNTGTGHANINDLLHAGHDFTRFLITLYPDIFLQHVVKNVGGLENFCLSRVITLPRNFQISDLSDPNKALDIREEKIYDEKLFSSLKQKIS